MMGRGRHDRNHLKQMRRNLNDLNWTDMTITDRYKCGPDSNLIQTNKKMTDWYMCNPKNPNSNWQDDDQLIYVWSQKLKLTGKWSIDIGATPKTQTKLTRRWPINIGAVPKTQTRTDKTMIDWYRYGPEKLKQN